MVSNATHNPTQMLTTKQAADYLNLSPASLNADRRTRKLNITYLKLGRKAVRYRVADLEAWLQTRVVRGSI